MSDEMLKMLFCAMGGTYLVLRVGSFLQTVVRQYRLRRLACESMEDPILPAEPESQCEETDPVREHATASWSRFSD